MVEEELAIPCQDILIADRVRIDSGMVLMIVNPENG